MKSINQPIPLVEPKKAVRSDLDAHPAPSSKWLTYAGWALVLAFVSFPFGIIAGDAIRSARAEAEFQRRWKAEQARMERLIQQMERGNTEQQRVAQVMRGGK